MNRLKTMMLAGVVLLVAPLMLRAQASSIVVVDFERAVVECQEGKKASDKFNGSLQAKQGEVEKKQKELEDQQKKLQNGARTLSEQAKGELQKDIDRRTKELQRLNEDAQKELGALRDELLRPIAERATAILQAMAAERGYTAVIDLSNQENNVIYFSEKVDITPELIKRIDSSTPADAGKTEAPKAPGATTPPANRPPAQANPATPRPTNPPPPVPKPTTQEPAPSKQ